jgi:hypothetical protein
MGEEMPEYVCLEALNIYFKVFISGNNISTS